MRTYKSIRSITILVVFAILINWGCFSDCTYAAQAQKQPAAKKQVLTQPAGTQPANIKPIETQTKGFILEGRAMYQSRGMKRVEITLTEYHSNGRVGITGKQTTDDQGYYKFAIQWNENVVKYKIVPKHPDLSSGENFSPQEKIFPRPSGTTNIDFAYTGPLPDLVVVSISDDAIRIKNEGGLAAGPFSIKCLFKCKWEKLGPDCHLKGPHPIVSLDGIAAGYSVDVSAPNPGCQCPGGDVTFRASHNGATLDVGNQVFESNEDNNSAGYGGW